MVIAEAMKLNLPTDEIEETDEPTVEETESPDPPPPMDEYERTVADADKGNKWSQYRAAKFMLDRDGDHYDPKKAVEIYARKIVFSWRGCTETNAPRFALVGKRRQRR